MKCRKQKPLLPAIVFRPCTWFVERSARESRRWRNAHRLHFLDVGDEVCKARLRARNEAGDHPFKTSEAEFEVISRYFDAPAVEEGFEVVRYA